MEPPTGPVATETCWVVVGAVLPAGGALESGAAEEAGALLAGAVGFWHAARVKVIAMTRAQASNRFIVFSFFIWIGIACLWSQAFR